MINLIDIEELRPILEELDVSAETIERVVAIDTHPDGGASEEQINELNK